MRQNDLPLDGLRVLDLGTFISAPFCGTLLAEFGAEVVKVEAPGAGDSLRTLGAQHKGLGLLWLQESRNKRAISCNLREPEGQEIIKALVGEGFDIVLENFRPGTMERWGLGYDDLKRVNERVILARVSGYGQTGPSSSKPMFGRIAQAFGGLTYLAGYPDRPPVNPGSATIADYLAGLFAAFGVLTAARSRDTSGKGQVIDVSLYESVLRILDSLTVTYGATGEVRERIGTATPMAAPHNHYPTRDGKWVAIACTNTRLFVRLAEEMGEAALAEDPRFKTERERVANREEIDEIVAAWTSSLDRTELLLRLEAAQVPSDAINSIADIFDNEHIRVRGSIMEVAHEQLGAVFMPSVVPRMSGTPGGVKNLGPVQGEATDLILQSVLKMTLEQVFDLRERGVI